LYATRQCKLGEGKSITYPEARKQKTDTTKIQGREEPCTKRVDKCCVLYVTRQYLLNTKHKREGKWDSQLNIR
jgi:hypothetical protein